MGWENQLGTTWGYKLEIQTLFNTQTFPLCRADSLMILRLPC